MLLMFIVVLSLSSSISDGRLHSHTLETGGRVIIWVEHTTDYMHNPLAPGTFVCIP